jgi:multicomponent Na+:H+ antiporter subunit C
VGCGLYMMLSRHAVRMILGLALLTNGSIFLIFFAGRMGFETPPVIPVGAEALTAEAANALPQALVLTAIVIGFALTAFAIVLVLQTYRALGTLDMREMQAAESLGAPDAPAAKVTLPDAPVTKVTTHG